MGDLSELRPRVKLSIYGIGYNSEGANWNVTYHRRNHRVVDDGYDDGDAPVGRGMRWDVILDRDGLGEHTYQGDFPSRNLILKYHIQYLLGRTNHTPSAAVPELMLLCLLALVGRRTKVAFDM